MTPNRLAGESSPYLLLHAHNPVAWYPWGEEALASARREDKPIFLSVGYSTCYWCHVMERESFSDPAIANLMNRDFINIKLDREERPELDEIYMTATQLLTEQGGWPNSIFLTPDLKPFFAGTYFPPADRHGRPGFPTVLRSLAKAWRERREEVEEQAEELAVAMRRHLEEKIGSASDVPGPEIARRALQSLERRFDPVHGGFGSAPKFPSPANLFLLLELAPEEPRAAEMLAATLDAMARGGIYDQLGGGFHRYATDRAWRVPHFEKMLYDNGLLLELYAREHSRTASPETARVVRRTAEFLMGEMSAPEGGFWSAIDAETAGDEGAFYVWAKEELVGVLGEEDSSFLAPLYGFAGPPFFEGDRYVLHVPEPIAAQAQKRRTPPHALWDQIEPLRAKLLGARGRRPRPATDDKVLSEWNGMAIGGLALAGQALGEPEWIARAARAADFLLDVLRPRGGPLLRTARAGAAKIPAFLADYAHVVRSLLALHETTADARWLEAALDLAREQQQRLGGPRGGFFTAAASSDVLFRSQEIFDGAAPAANAVAILNLLELARRTGDRTWREEAQRSLRAFAALIEGQPEAARMMAVAVWRYHRQGEETNRLMTLKSEAGSAGRIPDLLRQAQATVRARLEVGREGEHGWRSFHIDADIAEGWHIHSNPAHDEAFMPTELRAQGAELRRVKYPRGTYVRLRTGAKDLAAYVGKMTITGELRGLKQPAQLLLSFQPCDESRCLPPVTVELPLALPAAGA